MIISFNVTQQNPTIMAKTAVEWIRSWLLTRYDILISYGITDEVIQTLLKTGIISTLENAPKIFRLANAADASEYYDDWLNKMINSDRLRQQCFEMQRSFLQIAPRMEVNELIVNIDKYGVEGNIAKADFFVFVNKKDLSHAPVACFLVNKKQSDRYRDLLYYLNSPRINDHLAAICIIYSSDDVFSHLQYLAPDSINDCPVLHHFILPKSNHTPFVAIEGKTKREWLKGEKALEHRERIKEDRLTRYYEARRIQEEKERRKMIAEEQQHRKIDEIEQEKIAKEQAHLSFFKRLAPILKEKLVNRAPTAFEFFKSAAAEVIISFKVFAPFFIIPIFLVIALKWMFLHAFP